MKEPRADLESEEGREEAAFARAAVAAAAGRRRRSRVDEEEKGRRERVTWTPEWPAGAPSLEPVVPLPSFSILSLAFLKKRMTSGC